MAQVARKRHGGLRVLFTMFNRRFFKGIPGSNARDSGLMKSGLEWRNPLLTIRRFLLRDSLM